MNMAAAVARTLAIAIAVLGFVDPSLASLRPARADVAIVTMGRSDSALAKRLGDKLDDDYNVVRGPFANAVATIVVGTALPQRIPSGPLYAVADPTTPRITEFAVPAEVPVNARLSIPVSATAGRTELLMNGVVVDTSRAHTLTPTATGPAILHLCRPGRREGPAFCVDALTNVVDKQHAVLFFDRRPSWMSTFVRRSLEQDRRFAVASRVITSRGVSTDAGQPPSTLSDPALLELYDVIVIGAPTSLTAADISGLETFLRRRGGSVILLYDELPTAGAHDRLTGVSRWTPATLRSATRARAEHDSAALEITEAAWPATLPVAADVRAMATLAGTDRPLVWTTGAGAGQVIVSGALDSWKFRDPSTSGFDEFWRAMISRAAREASQAVTVSVEPNIAEPGEPMTVRITLRDSLARPALTIDSALLDAWPTNQPGEFVARLRAPSLGDHWIRAAAGGAKAEAPIAVRATVTRAERQEWPTLQMVSRASGGVAGSLDEVEHAIRQRVVSEKRMDRWWPMRSGWWIIPFTALLGFEWILRRRRGLA